MTTKKKPDEQKQQINVEAEKSIAQIKDPELKNILAGIWERVKHTDIQKEAEQIKKKIAEVPKRPEQLVFAFMPHEMAKVSIFFPMSDKELKEERRLIQKLEHESSWGKLTVEGVKLAIFEEDIFLVLMKIAKKKIKQIGGQYILETNVKEIIHILYGRAGYTKRAYELIRRALGHFQMVRFVIALKREGKEISIADIIQRCDYDEKTNGVKIYFNPHFCVFFLESMLTSINFTIRRKLKKDGSKALLRFLSTHTNPGRMHLLTVLSAINFNTNQPMYRLRSRFKQFISELKKNGVLGSKTRLYKDDTVYFDVLPPKKALPE